MFPEPEENIMINFFIGALIMAGFFLLISFVRHRDKRIRWWQWLLTIAGFCYLTFVLEVIIGFLSEGASRAALVNGVILGIAAVIWAVLLGRFVFTKNKG